MDDFAPTICNYEKESTAFPAINIAKPNLCAKYRSNKVTQGHGLLKHNAL